MKKYSQYMISALLLACAFLGMVPAQAVELVTYYHNNPLGSPLAASDEYGNELWNETYRPFGDRVVQDAAADDNRIWYTGKPQDSATGLSYYGARYYDSVLGRFMAIDPVGFQDSNLHSFNRYAYANNNPYRFVDPDGRAAIIVLPILILAEIVFDTTFEPDVPFDSGVAQTSITLTPVPLKGAGLLTKATGQVTKGPLWSSTKSKTAVENAFGHFKKHKSEFPEFQNAKQYVEGTKKFLNSPPKGTLTKTNSRGDTLRYDPNTNTFGVRGKDGTPRTMFRPKNGIDYWNRQ